MTVHEHGNGLVESRWQLANAEVDDDQRCFYTSQFHYVCDFIVRTELSLKYPESPYPRTFRGSTWELKVNRSVPLLCVRVSPLPILYRDLYILQA